MQTDNGPRPWPPGAAAGLEHAPWAPGHLGCCPVPWHCPLQASCSVHLPCLHPFPPSGSSLMPPLLNHSLSIDLSNASSVPTEHSSSCEEQSDNKRDKNPCPRGGYGWNPRMREQLTHCVSTLSSVPSPPELSVLLRP